MANHHHHDMDATNISYILRITKKGKFYKHVFKFRLISWFMIFYKPFLS